MTAPTKNLYLLPRLGWMLYDDINRRLSILVEECLHLQQVVHYHGDFDIAKKNNAEEDSEQPAMLHFKQIVLDEYKRHTPTTRAMLALYEHLGGLTLGLKSHQTEVRSRFDRFLYLQAGKSPETEQNEAWFWFVALRGHLLHEVIEMYMEHLEHAHEKLIQILETKPGALPQPILLRRWNSALHGRFLSDYSRHIEWETHLLFNRLKKDPANDEGLEKKRHFSTFIHSWAHTPTSMVSTFKVNDQGKSKKEQIYQLGSIRSAFFYLEMPQLYPLLYHECAHLRFNWDSDAKNDEGVFFTSRKNAANSLKESAQLYQWDRDGFWDNFTDEIWADTLAINLGGMPYLTALTMQIMGQSSGRFFYSDLDIPLQDWAKQPVYDLELPTQDAYFWQARLELAMNWLKTTHPEECVDNEMNKQWLTAIELGIKAYTQGGASVFSAQRVSSQHDHWWHYRTQLNQWVYSTIEKYQDQNSSRLKQENYKIFSKKYWISENLLQTVIIPIVKNFEKRFFKESKECSYGDGDVSIKGKKGVRRIEYLPFHIKWYLSKRVMKALFDEPGQQSIETFTFAYANNIRNDGGAAFRIALEWIVARNDLNSVFADYFADFKKIEPQIEKLKKTDKDNPLFNPEDIQSFQSLAEEKDINYNRDGLREAKKAFILHLIYQKSYNAEEQHLQFPNFNSIKNQVNNFIDNFLDVYVVKQLAAIHAQERVSIGTFTLGSAKRRSRKEDKESTSYLNAWQGIDKYYKAVRAGLNHPEEIVPKADMPIDFNTKKPFFYDADETNPHAPAKSKLYFITGDYDFMHQQDGITPAESIFHPASTLAMMTKSRTVLDLYIPSDEIKRQCFGRISLVKFRYRWEMYLLSEQLKTAPYRARLRLSSAWEDGILITWHETSGALWKDGFSETLLADNGTADTQTSLILFKLNEKGEAVKSYNEDKINFTPLITTEKNHFGRLIKELVEKGIFKKAMATLGRFDYVVEWQATTPEELASAMFSLPKEFWENIAHINTTFRHRSVLITDAEESFFVSEITVNTFTDN